MRFQVIYLWQGERHRDLADYATMQEALNRAAAFVSDGWHAWVEGTR